MKKILSIFMFILLIFTFISCQSAGGSNDLISSLPSTVKAIGYVNVEKTLSLDATKEILEKQADEDMIALFKEFKTVVIGMSEFDMDMKNPNMFVLLSGKYDKSKIEDQIKKRGGNVENKKVLNIDGFTGQGITALYLKEDLIGLAVGENPEELVKSAVEGKDTISKDSDVFKNASKMNNNLLWVATDLASMEEIPLGQLSGGMFDLPDVLKLENGSFGVSENNGTLSINLSVGVGNDKDASKIADTGNQLISSVMMFAGEALEQLPKDVADDVKTILKNLKLNTNGKNLSTKLDIKISTIEKLGESGLVNQLGGGF